MQIRHSILHLAILAAFWATIYAAGLSSPPMFDDTDTVHAEAVREMVESGDWVTLRINNGFRYLEKAPLMYWLSALTVTLFGLSEWTVRFPVALAHLCLTFLIYQMGERFWTRRTGFYAALIYITSLGPYAFTRVLHPDVILTFFITLSLYFYLQVFFELEPVRRRPGPFDMRCMGLYASAALAVLTKGLIGVIFVGMIIFAHLILSGRWEVLKRLQIIPGALLFLLIAAPWHIAAGFANQGFFWFYFVNEHFLRYLGMRYPTDWARMPLWLFWVLLLVWVFPWTVFSWGLVRTFPKTLRPATQTGQINQFLYLWGLLILVFYSFSTTQEYYTFPSLPAFALLLAQVLTWLESPEGKRDERKGLVGLAVLSGACVIASGVLLAMVWLGSESARMVDLSDTMTANPDRYLITFGRLQEMSLATFAKLSSVIYQTALVLIIGPVAAFCAGWVRKWDLSAVFLAIMMVGVLYSYRNAMVALEPVITSKDLARVIEQQYRPNDRLVINGIYENGSSINFYTGIQMCVLNGYFGNLWYGSYFPDAPQIFYDDASFTWLWNSDTRVFFFTSTEDLKAFKDRNPDFSYHVLAESGGKKVLVNRQAVGDQGGRGGDRPS
jgi:4-amino-4-deoxy-L-arabinose transferase-like glycosyltransferase